MLFYALDPPDSGRKVGTQKPAIRSFVGEPANGGKAQVDSGGSILGLFEVDPVARHHGLLEGWAGFRAVPVDELTDRVVVRAWGAVGVRLLRTADFDCSRSGSFRTILGMSQALRTPPYAGAFRRT